jgi:hypothetical protein
MTRVLDGAVHVWCVITARKDPHKAYGDRFFVPESMIEVR